MPEMAEAMRVVYLSAWVGFYWHHILLLVATNVYVWIDVIVKELSSLGDQLQGSQALGCGLGVGPPAMANVLAVHRSVNDGQRSDG